jgi:hypothetical protein
MGAIKRGNLMISAALPSLLMALVFLGALGTSNYALADEPTTLRWVPAVIPGLALALLAWRFHAFHWPYTISELSDLEHQLPR